ncbi:MAG: hypothetical protein ACI9TH_001623 [Kiritimatiellia bacterium]|jgi:hypothetical protein
MKQAVIILVFLPLWAAAQTGFLTEPSGDPPERIARSFLAEGRAEPADLNVLRQWQDAHNGLHHFVFQQALLGLPVFGEHLCIHVTGKGQVVSCHGTLRELDALPPATLDAAQARLAAQHALQLPVGEDLVAVQMIYFPEQAPACVVWNMMVEAPDGHCLLDVNVDARSGQVIWQNDLVRHCTHRVFAPPLESADLGPQTIVENAPDPTASPFGWHDTNGLIGPEFTDTRGNNVHAQEDTDGNNTGGLRPDGGAELDFDFPFDPNQAVSGNQAAAVVNVFFWANYVHDVLYRYGFNEAAGNFQFNNYGNGGAAGDPVLLDIQDSASVNNATFAAPADGVSGRMQLHLWVNGSITVTVSSPLAIAGSLPGNGAQFGGIIPTNGISSEVVLALDPPDPPLNSTTDACSAITNTVEIAGKIALIDRGECFFTEKVKHAQDAGAIAVIVANHQGENLVRMAGADASIVIPSVFIRQSAGEAIKAQLALGETVEVTINGSPERDAAFDNAVIVHEFAHGLTSRLTGGPLNANCLSSRQSASLGEGWSDFFGLVFTQQPSDLRETLRPVGGYVVGDGSGPGIRSIPYAADLPENALTLEDIELFSEIHNVGEVWCLALWGMYWDFVEHLGYDPDLIEGQGGNNLCLQLVLDGLKLQSCNPTFTEARDAILLADQVNNNGRWECLIWRAFARRGIGSLADAGSASQTASIAESFSAPEPCLPDIHLQLDPLALVPDQLSWLPESAAVYQVQQHTNLFSPDWIDIPGGRITAGVDRILFDLQMGSSSQRYYRVQLREAP